MNTFRELDSLVEHIMGPTKYSGVTMLRHAAEFCADQVLVEASRDESACDGFVAATLLLHDMADCLDAELVNGVN